MVNTVMPLISCLISLVFALAVLDQYFARRKAYQLVWAIGLFMYFISTGTEFLTGMWGLNDIVYRVWYLVGAIFVAAYLGMGTLYLLVRRKTANIIMVILVVVSIYATFKVFTAPVNLGVIQTLSGQAMPKDVRLLTPFFNSFGTLALVGGALYSAWVFWRRRILPHRVISNVLIAIGAILPAIGGTSMRFGNPALFYLLELLGVIIIFIGFLRTKEVFGLYRIPFSQGFHRIPTK